VRSVVPKQVVPWYSGNHVINKPFLLAFPPSTPSTFLHQRLVHLRLFINVSFINACYFTYAGDRLFDARLPVAVVFDARLQLFTAATAPFAGRQ